MIKLCRNYFLATLIDESPLLTDGESCDPIGEREHVIESRRNLELSPSIDKSILTALLLGLKLALHRDSQRLQFPRGVDGNITAANVNRPQATLEIFSPNELGADDNFPVMVDVSILAVLHHY